MKVSEAIEVLKEADPDARVYISSDEEGNSHREACISFPHTMCDQDGDIIAIHPDDLVAGEYEGWEDNMFQAVILW